MRTAIITGAIIGLVILAIVEIYGYLAIRYRH